MSRFLLVCAGGAAGTAARYLTALWAGAAFGPGAKIVNARAFNSVLFIDATVDPSPSSRLQRFRR
jgi:fluoride ion exporter CrcB/FEX